MKMTEHRFSVGRGAQTHGYRHARQILLERNWAAHPATSLLAAHRNEMRENRAKLLREVGQVSEPLARGVAEMLRVRDTLSPPAIGEVWPWLLGDLAHLSLEKVRVVAKAWLAVYIYTLLLDRACDAPKIPLDHTDTLAGALLFEVGLGDFYTMTAGTAWQKVIRDSVRSAIRYQEVDVRMAGQLTHIASKQRSAAGKNAGFVICAAALAAVSNLDGSTLNRFAHSVLLAFQHLDDIADFEDDWKAKNFTPLLVRARDQLKRIGDRKVDRLEILEALLKSGALRKVLAETQSGISLGLRDVANAYGKLGHSNASKFFGSLQTAITLAIEIVDRNTPLLTDPLSEMSRRAALKDVEHRLQIVAQQS